ncbi:hypothetical protein G7047_10805 [Diaphorobacter sp. HDW4A]|uniref:hypothetical protein n=1 Tax=Diaphorobacter sp. HDW4A TaxID=2714924 RepID=UPI00140DD56E|nr:hypothetical protein [Diaphorobacter sp. HDW4A]QIL80335.1 hypothetical protein G7047_10805 [Diaphorobacter sp. HDW4A]
MTRENGSPKPWKRMRWLVVACALAVPLVSMLLIAALQHFVRDASDLATVQRVSGIVHALGLVLQCMAVATLIWKWRALVDWGKNKGFVREAEYESALAYRAKASTFLLLYLILIPIGPWRIWVFFKFWMGA